MPTRKELNLAIFEGTAERVLWQPRLETWIHHHRDYGTLPERFRGKSDFEIYDALRCSVRYGGVGGLRRPSPEGVETATETLKDHTIETIRTPIGELRRVYKDIYDNGRRVNHRIEDFPVKTIDELRVARYIVEHQQFQADVADYHRAAERLGDRAQPVRTLISSGLTDLIKHWCGLPGTYYLLTDHPAEVEAYLAACDARDDRLLDEALKLPVKLFELGDHATNEFTPPPILKKYMIPRWRRIAGRIHARGGFVWSHWDGNSRLMLPYLRETHLDAVEALTPAPMGDMTLEMIKQAVGDRIVCLDLIPVIDFLPNNPTQKLLDFTRRVIDMFAPRLILGISDELSPPGEIAKVEAVGELVDKVCGLAD